MSMFDEIGRVIGAVLLAAMLFVGYEEISKEYQMFLPSTTRQIGYFFALTLILWALYAVVTSTF